jgi:hypothetical protein
VPAYGSVIALFWLPEQGAGANTCVATKVIKLRLRSEAEIGTVIRRAVALLTGNHNDAGISLVRHYNRRDECRLHATVRIRIRAKIAICRATPLYISLLFH